MQSYLFQKLMLRGSQAVDSIDYVPIASLHKIMVNYLEFVLSVSDNQKSMEYCDLELSKHFDGVFDHLWIERIGLAHITKSKSAILDFLTKHPEI